MVTEKHRSPNARSTGTNSKRAAATAARRAKRQRGAAVIELALGAPLVLLLTVSAFDFGRAVWTRQQLSYLVNDAVRFASVHSAESQQPINADDVRERVISKVTGLDADRLAVATSWNPANSRGATVEIDLRYDYAPIFPLVPTEMLDLSARARLLVSH